MREELGHPPYSIPRPEFYHIREYDTEIHGNAMIPSRTDKQEKERYVEPKDHDYKYMYLTTIRQQDVESIKTRACLIHPRQTIGCGLLASRCCTVPFTWPAESSTLGRTTFAQHPD